MYRISIGLLVAGVIAFAPALTPAGELPAIQDTFTDATAPATNYGRTDTLRVQKVGTRIALIRFDLASAPQILPEQTALLRIKVDDVNRGGRIEVRRVLSGWDEGTVTFNTPLIISPQVVATYDVKPEDEGKVISLDVSAATAEWARAPEKNFGLSISAADFGGSGRPYLSLASREQAAAATLSFVGQGADRVAVARRDDVALPKLEADVAVARGAGDAQLDSNAQFLRR
jgi:hypothetical protein